MRSLWCIAIRVATLPPSCDTSHVAALEPLLLTLPEAAKARGDAFEHLTKWYLENSPSYGALILRVWRWEDWPRRWGRDAGIDLVAAHRKAEVSDHRVLRLEALVGWVWSDK